MQGNKIVEMNLNLYIESKQAHSMLTLESTSPMLRVKTALLQQNLIGSSKIKKVITTTNSWAQCRSHVKGFNDQRSKNKSQDVTQNCANKTRNV